MQAIVAPAPAAPVTSVMAVVAQSSADASAPTNPASTHFAKMLKAADKPEQADKEDTATTDQPAGNDVSADSSGSNDQSKSDSNLLNDHAARSVAAYVAQQINAQSTAATQEATVSTLTGTALLSQTVSPQDASAAIDILNTQGTHDSVTSALKNILSDIQTSGVPQTIGAIVSKLVAAQPTTDGKTSPQSVALMQRALKLLQMNGTAAAVTTATAASTTDASADASSDTKDAADNQDMTEISASLLAGLFRAAAPTQTAPAETNKKDTSVTDANASALMVTITPLNSMLIAQQTGNTNNTKSNGDTVVSASAVSTTPVQLAAASQVATHTDAVDATTTDMSSTLDAMIPSLALPESNTGDASQLPPVNLPKASIAGDSAKDAKAATPTATSATTDTSVIGAATTLDKATTDLTQALGRSKQNNVQSVGDVAAKPAAPTAQQPDDATKKINQATGKATAPTTPAASDGVATQTADGKTPVDKSSDTPNATTGQAKTDTNFSALVTQEVAGTHHSDATSAVTTQSTSNTPQPATEQVQVAMTRAVKDGIGHITIQLDPGDLGRVEVKMHTGADGVTQVSFTVDKPSTLDSLARSAQGLERSLQESGVKTDAGNMQFNLRQQPQTLDTGTGHGQGRQSPQPQADAGDTTGNGSQQANNNGIPAAAVIARNYTVNVSTGLDIHA